MGKLRHRAQAELAGEGIAVAGVGADCRAMFVKNQGMC